MLDWTSVHRCSHGHIRAFLSFFCVLLSIQCTLSARINVLSQSSEGAIFAFSHDPRIQYLAAAQSVATINLKEAQISPSFPSDSDSGALNGQLLSPATSVWIRGSSTSLREQVEAYRETGDDVWNERFLETLFVLNHGASTAEVDVETYAWLRSLEVKRLFLSGSIKTPPHAQGSIPTYRLTDAPSIPAGPFVISTTNASEEMSLHNVYRLYVDEYDAFVFGAIPDLINARWLPTNLTTSEEDGPPNQIIPVPSRLASLFTLDAPSKPLAGLRFALKDIFDAQNLPTAGGSLSYLLTHPSPPNRTAPSIAPLLALGATLLGKTRTSQFAHGAQPWEFLDYSYSYNPRGDGWLTAAASSSGSACAVAGYAWLDFAVGSDTRGSVRKPAALVGVFGIRPSWGSLGVGPGGEGVVPLSEEMDTVGFFARDVRVFWEVAMHWYAGSEVWNRSPRTRFPRKLYYPTDHFPMSNPAAQALVDTFISHLQTHPFNIQPLHVNFTSILTPLLPNGSFADFQRFSNRLAEYRSWVSVGRPTTEAFWERFGREPRWDPVPARMFEKAKGISEEEFEEAVEVKRAFSGAVNEHIFKPDPESCSDSLFIYDAATGGVPSYRVEEMNYLSGSTPFLMNAPVPPNTNTPSTLSSANPSSPPPSPRAADFFNFLASMGELPEVTIPIGQAEYFSPVSRAWEPIPVAVQVVARRGCDAVLVDLVRALGESRGGVRGVEVGRSMF